jgi:GNAT superfamily N-acetyltransferase
MDDERSEEDQERVSAYSIAQVGEPDLADLLPLLRAYCDFYEVQPTDDALLAMCRALIADPEREGVQLLARDAAGRAVAFTTIYWCWQTLETGRIGIMNDLFVCEDARGTGLADDMIHACVDRAREHGATSLTWQTARSNRRAQKVYDRVGGTAAMWISYELPTAPSSIEQPE